MAYTEKEFKKLAAFILLILLGILSFILLKPVLLSVIGGLILAYIFTPIRNKIGKYIKNKNISSFIICFFIILIIFLPLWFIAPLVVQQIFEIFRLSQALDVQKFVSTVFPTSNTQFTLQVASGIINFIGQIASASLNSLAQFLLNFHVLLLNISIIILVFFFSLRDSEELNKFITEFSPFAKDKEEAFIKQFKNITDSIIYGQIIIGIVQGILVGIGLFVFSVPNALFLTLLATIFGMIPMIGTPLVWIPVTIYLFSKGPVTAAVIYLLFNAFIVSNIDNILRPYIVSQKTNISSAIILVGMIGGLFIFGVLGFILGPLILAYFLMLLKAYKEKKLESIFSSE